MTTAARERAAKRTARPATRTAKPLQPRSNVANWFRQFLTANDQIEVLEERCDTLRKRLLEAVVAKGHESEGHYFLELTEPVEFKSHDGEVTIYRTLKRERHLIPAVQLPDPEKSVALLKKLKLWIKPAQEKILEEIGLSNPYIRINVTVDADAVAQAYYKELISEEEYDALLPPQKEQFQFKKLKK
jgi:hypothetical protein